MNPIATYGLKALTETLSVFSPTREAVIMTKGQEKMSF